MTDNEIIEEAVRLAREGVRRPTPDPSLNGGEWYDLSGQKLVGKPTKKGLSMLPFIIGGI